MVLICLYSHYVFTGYLLFFDIFLFSDRARYDFLVFLCVYLFISKKVTVLFGSKHHT
jgi:hypothetical protein